MKKILIAFIFLILPFGPVSAQMFAINVEAPPELTVTVKTGGVLDFETVLQNNSYDILLDDPKTEIISIEGQKNKSVEVTISAQDLMLDASNTIPYTLGAAYANQGRENIEDAITFNGNTAIFEVNGQGSQNDSSNDTGNSSAPGGGGGGSTATAYVYIYGGIEVGNVKAGKYKGQITISVTYTN
ncbi:hypothetical protein [Fodinibius sp. AD559]|uniref:hypothetical protein n=1 Tax=Fodinibius sp. AD559 TaxID=3424179 RepID=UPI004046FD9F